MDNTNQSAKADKKSAKSDNADAKGRNRKFSKVAGKQSPSKIEVSSATIRPEIPEEPIPSIYHEEVIANYMLQESLPDDEAMAFTLTEEQQTAIFGTQALSSLKKDEAPGDADPDAPPKPPTYCGLSRDKTELLGVLDSELTDQNLDVLREKVNDYPGTCLTFIADPSQKFGGNFLLILSQELDNQFRIEKLEVVPTKTEKEDVMEEANDSVAYIDARADKPWVSQGSDREIIQASFFETRPRVVTNYERPRREFCAPSALVNLDARKMYNEVKPYEDKSFEVPILELEKGVCCTNLSSEHYTNTEWRYPRNQVVQYEARSMGPEDLQTYTGVQTPLKGIGNLLPIFEQGLKQNLMYDFLFDDYINLALGDDTYDNKSGNTFKEVISFTDLKFSKDKAVTHIEWHPTIEGLVAMSVGEKLTYDARIEQWSRILTTPSFIIIWSFFEPIQPQLLLEAPEDILCFQFSPTDPNIIAGGCFNGEVILWDISRYEKDLSDVIEKVKSKTKVPLFQFDENDALKVPISPWCASSNFDASHGTPITQLEWVPDHIELTRAGFVTENPKRKCIQLMTCAIEGGVFFWDIRPEKSPLAIDKTRDQLTVPKDVPLTFAALDAKWKPILRVSLFRPENGPEHCARRFCMRERQGDRSILESRANVKKKMAAEKDPTKIGLAKLPPLEGINSHLYVGTEDGDIVYVDWMPQKDTQTAKMQTTMPVFFATQHDGPISYLNRSPFLPEVLLCVGGWTWSLWKEGVNTGPLISSCACSKAYTGGCWSPTRPSVFFVIRADGTLESWDLLDKTHEPALMQNVSASALTSISIKVEGKKQLMAVGDMHGALRVLIVPHRMKVCGATELDAMNTYIDREVRRRDFVLARWNKREQERIEKENENKRMAGIATVGKLTDEEILKKWRAEYEVYLAGEREFLRALGLFHEEEEDQPAAAQPEAAPA